MKKSSKPRVVWVVLDGDDIITCYTKRTWAIASASGYWNSKQCDVVKFVEATTDCGAKPPSKDKVKQ